MPSGAGSWARRPWTSGSQPLELGDCRLCQLGPLPRRGLRATAGIWGTTQVCWEAPRLTLSVSGLHPSSNLCICCQLRFYTRHRAQRPSHIDTNVLLHSSQQLHEVSTNNSPIFKGGNLKKPPREAKPLAQGCSGRKGQAGYLNPSAQTQS